MRIFAALLCVAYMAKGAPQSPAFHSETRVVLVDAVVTGKKGEYIRDLTAKDFRIFEDNKEQTIRSLSLEADSSTEPRRLVLFFDNTGMSTADQANARQAAASFIDTSAGPNRLMAVVNFDDGVRVVQSFTESAARLKDAVRGLRVTGASPGAAPREVAVGTAEANARNLLQSLANLAQNLNAIPGRKIIVLFTGSGSGAGAQPADVASLVQMSNRSNVAIYPVAPVAAPAQDAAENSIPFALARRGMNNSSNALRADRSDDSLPFTIAGGTGGFVISASNDLLAQLQKIGAEQGQSYVLGYSPPDSKEGACHTLRVKVDRGEVRARSSYCTAKPQDVLAESRVEQDLEKRAAAADTGNAASIQAPFFYVASNVARVHVAMEIATEALKFENQKGKLHAEMNILGIASSSDGAVAARFSDIVRRDFDDKQDLDKWKAKPLHYEKEFKIVPGQYNLTVVFSSGGASFGKIETSLSIPAYNQSQFTVSGLALGGEVRPASELGLETSLIDDGTPLLAGGMQLIPTGSKVFTKPGQAFCYFEVYMPGPGEPATVTLRILDAKTGMPKWSGGAAGLDPPAGGKTTIPVGLVLPLESLSPGSYQAEAAVADGAGNTVTRTVDFEIK